MPQRDDPPTPRLRRTRTSSARLSARSRTTCQAVASRVISSDVSDYRNPIIAEAMKVLGYVNCYNRGINMVQDELDANGNGKAEFSFRLITAFEAKVALAGNGLSDKLPESGTIDGTIDGTMALRIVSVIEKEPSVTMDQLSEKLSVARRTLVRYMNILQENKRIKRVGGKRFGHWEVVE